MVSLTILITVIDLGLKAKAKIYRHTKAKTEYLLIPSEIANDSAYPFSECKDVVVKIDVENKRLIVEERK